MRKRWRSSGYQAWRCSCSSLVGGAGVDPVGVQEACGEGRVGLPPQEQKTAPTALSGGVVAWTAGTGWRNAPDRTRRRGPAVPFVWFVLICVADRLATRGCDVARTSPALIVVYHEWGQNESTEAGWFEPLTCGFARCWNGVGRPTQPVGAPMRALEPRIRGFPHAPGRKWRRGTGPAGGRNISAVRLGGGAYRPGNPST